MIGDDRDGCCYIRSSGESFCLAFSSLVVFVKLKTKQSFDMVDASAWDLKVDVPEHVISYVDKIVEAGR